MSEGSRGFADASPFSALDIRLARPDEHEVVDALVTGAYAHDYGPSEHTSPMHSAAIRAERFDVWVAHAPEGSLLGSITTRRKGGPSLHEDVVAHEFDLRLLAVSPEARRRGIGAALMRFVAAEAERQGFDAVVLKTAPNMVGAHRLYESLGYVRDPERTALIIGGERMFELFTYVRALRSH